jgi:hypothetical protein
LQYDKITRKITVSRVSTAPVNMNMTTTLRAGDLFNKSADEFVKNNTYDVNKRNIEVISSRDLSLEDVCLQCSTGSGGLYYYRLDGKAIETPDLVKDAWYECS